MPCTVCNRGVPRMHQVCWCGDVPPEAVGASGHRMYGPGEEPNTWEEWWELAKWMEAHGGGYVQMGGKIASLAPPVPALVRPR